MSNYRIVGCSKCHLLQISTGETYFNCKNDSCRSRQYLKGRKVFYEDSDPACVRNVLQQLKGNANLRRKFGIV